MGKRDRNDDDSILYTNKGDVYLKRCTYNDVDYAIDDLVWVQCGGKKLLATIMTFWEPMDPKSSTMAEVRYYIPVDDTTLSKAQILSIKDGSETVPHKEESSNVVDENEQHVYFETDQVDEVSCSWIKGHCGAEDRVSCKNYLWSVYAKILKPFEEGLSRKQRSKFIYSKRNHGHAKKPATAMEVQDSECGDTSATISPPQWKCAEIKLQAACAKLQLSSTPDILLCREKERSKIGDSIRHAIQIGHGNALYVNGLQGIGKTATVMQVIRVLEAESASGSIRPFEFIEINGMKLAKPEQAYLSIWDAMQKHNRTVKQVSASRICSKLEVEFSRKSHDRPMIVLLIDEIDCLAKSSAKAKNEVLYNFLSWPKIPNSKLFVIGIANTMDLPERLSTKLGSRFGVDRVCFQPYTSEQIEKIVEQRIGEWDIFDKDAIQVYAKKIAQRSGDIRKALNLCKRAAEECLKRVQEGTENGDINAEKSTGLISFKDIRLAMKESSASPIITFLSCVPKFLCFFIASLAKETQKALQSDREDEVEFIRIFDGIKTISRITGTPEVSVPSISQAIAICNQLERCCVIICYRSKVNRYPKIRLNLALEELKAAWKSHNVGQDLINKLGL